MVIWIDLALGHWVAPYLSPSTEKVNIPVILSPFADRAVRVVVGHLTLNLCHSDLASDIQGLSGYWRQQGGRW